MKKIFLAFVLIFSFATMVQAGAIADGSLGISSGVSVFKNHVTIPDDTAYMIMSAYGGNIRYRFKSNPGSTQGHVLYNGDTFVLANPGEVHSIKFILDNTSSGGTLEYTIFGK